MNKRKHSRITLDNPIRVKAQVFRVGDTDIWLDRYALFRLENVSLNGLRMVSDLSFPIAKGVFLSLEIPLFGRINQIQGKIVWKKRRKDKKFEYGFEITNANIGYIRTITYLLNNELTRIRLNS